jgi:creatinine amidohydrolase
MLHGYTPPHRFLPYLSWTDIAALPDRENTVIMLPVGAIEQHGPHLPCAVDSCIAAGVVGHALHRLPTEIPAFAMAPLTYGKSDEHLHFPGTMTLTGATLLAMVTEIGESVYRAGFRKLVLVNGHGVRPVATVSAAIFDIGCANNASRICMAEPDKRPSAANRFSSAASN